MFPLITGLTDRLVYPAPTPTYTENDLNGCLCWLPWNEAIPAPPSRTASTASPSSPSDFNSIKALPCLWLPAKRSANVVFYFHANAEDLGVVHSALVHLQKQLQVSVLAIEYPGYGLLKDYTASEEGICSAALVALRYINSEVGVDYNQVMLLGRSLGSGPAVYLAARFPVGGLLLVNPFASLRAAAECHVGKALSKAAFKDSFDNESLICNVSCAVLFIHAARDRTVPMEHSARLFKKCRSRKLLITPDGMEHNSHLFADPSFLAVPAIHFFHFPCYQTEHPPALPPQVFKQPRAQSDPLKPESHSSPWSCAGKFCSSKDGEPDEVAIPADAVQGHVDVADKLLSARLSTGQQPLKCPAARLFSPCPIDDGAVAAKVVEEEAAFQPFSARNRYPGTPVTATTQVAPGDESAGWPGRLSKEQQGQTPQPINFPVRLDKLPEKFDIEV